MCLTCLAEVVLCGVTRVLWPSQQPDGNEASELTAGR